MTMSKLKEWADSVKGRDGKCLECGSVEDLHAHHVKPKATHPELILDVENGKTLCYRCHKREHERNRPPRMRSVTDRPQRKTLLRQLEKLRNEVDRLRRENQRLEIALDVRHKQRTD